MTFLLFLIILVLLLGLGGVLSVALNPLFLVLVVAALLFVWFAHGHSYYR